MIFVILFFVVVVVVVIFEVCKFIACESCD